MQIPYTIEAREDTGLYNGKVAMWLFLASEVMLFGALFSAYILLRVGHPAWPLGREMGLSIPRGTLNTAILIGSGITILLAWAALRFKDFAGYKKWMGLTILLGVAFMVVKGTEYYDKFQHGHLPSTHTFYAMYFVLTALHALHVLGGIAVNAWLWGPGARMWETEPERLTNRVELSGLFWHFVDLVWMFLFPVLYLL